MSFTTVDRVRDESWFTWELNISDNSINWYLIQANWIIISNIATVYDASKLIWSLFVWSHAENMLKRIEELLASGYLLIKEYGPEWRDTDKDGYIKIKEAEKLLDKIINGDIKLFDINYVEFWRQTTSSWALLKMTTPDNNLNLTPIFTTKDRF